jgi:hypothetical protein
LGFQLQLLGGVDVSEVLTYFTHFYPEDGDSIHLRNVSNISNISKVYTVHQNIYWIHKACRQSLEGQISRYSEWLRGRRLEFDSWQGPDIFSQQRTDMLWSPSSLLQMGTGKYLSEEKRPGLKINHSLLPSPEVKNGRAIPPFLHSSIRLHDVTLN